LSEDLLSKALRLLESRGCVTTDDLMHYLGISLQEVNTLLGILIGEGIVEEVNPKLRCGLCPLSPSCHMKSSRILKTFKLRSSKSM